jgi:hypothetical protein
MSEANATELVLQFIDALDAAGVQYMLVGSYSSNYYGRPRSTKDADFVVQIDEKQLTSVTQRLGPEFRLDRQMTFETVTMTVRYIINHSLSAFKIELFLLSDDDHDRERFRRKQKATFEGRSVWLPTAEDVVITKLRWSRAGARAKDAADVAGILAVQRNSLDLDYIRRWLDRHGTRDVFEALLIAASRER